MSTRVEDLNFQLSSEQGRRIWWRELEALGLLVSSLTADATGAVDLGRTAFAEGRRSIAVDRMAEVRQFCPEKFRLAVLENFAPNIAAPTPKEK